MHKDSHRLIGNFGGYGTGKSLTDFKDLTKHLLITPNADALVTANVSYQYEQTIKKELERDIPAAFVADYSVKQQKMTLLNGATLGYRPLDDPDKLRSLNLTYFLIIEGSETDSESFHQLKTRLRNMNSMVAKKDEKGNTIYNTTKDGRQIPVIDVNWGKGVVESNPDSGWVYTDLLLASDTITHHGIPPEPYTQQPEEIDKFISSHISSTEVNKYLPVDFIEMITKNKPSWWINRYVYSSFMYAEGMVYPDIRKTFKKTPEIQPHWKRIVVFDYGLSDDAVWLYGAIDPIRHKVIVYKEQVVNNKTVKELSELFHEGTKDIPQGTMLTNPIMDPMNNKRDYNKKDLATHFAEYGVYTKPGHKNKAARIDAVNTYTLMDALEISDDCPYLQEQIAAYKFKERKLSDKGAKAAPKDGADHAVVCLEWMLMELPLDPRRLQHGVYNRTGEQVLAQAKKVMTLPHALQTKEDFEQDYSEFSVPGHDIF